MANLKMGKCSVFANTYLATTSAMTLIPTDKLVVFLCGRFIALVVLALHYAVRGVKVERWRPCI